MTKLMIALSLLSTTANAATGIAFDCTQNNNMDYKLVGRACDHNVDLRLSNMDWGSMNLGTFSGFSKTSTQTLKTYVIYVGKSTLPFEIRNDQATFMDDVYTCEISADPCK